jgi:hypothetical protein
MSLLSCAGVSIALLLANYTLLHIPTLLFELGLAGDNMC